VLVYPYSLVFSVRYDGGVGDVRDSYPVCEASRQRMKPWLQHNINSGLIPGLQWMDKERQVFKVPWKRVANREWSEADGAIFKVRCFLDGFYVTFDPYMVIHDITCPCFRNDFNRRSGKRLVRVNL